MFERGRMTRLELIEQIKSICGTACEEYQDLAEAINDSSKT